MINLLLLAVLAQQQGVQLLDEGVQKGQVNQIDCVGAGIACTVPAGSKRGTLTVTGGGTGGGSGGAPTDSPFVTFAASDTLTNERVLTDGQNTTVELNGSQAKVNVTGVLSPAQLGVGAPDVTTFLRGDGTWAPVPMPRTPGPAFGPVLKKPPIAGRLPLPKCNTVRRVRCSTP